MQSLKELPFEVDQKKGEQPTVLIGRDWYQLTSWKLTTEGACPGCQTPCAGVFESIPGSWGPRSLPVRINPAS